MIIIINQLKKYSGLIITYSLIVFHNLDSFFYKNFDLNINSSYDSF